MKVATRYDNLSQILTDAGQNHLLRFWHDLSEQQQESLADQILSIDWELVGNLVRGIDKTHDWAALAARADVPPAIDLKQQREPEFRRRMTLVGNEAIAAGEVAFVLTAGGQGSRLGFEHPKGMFPVGPVSHRTLFQIMLDHCRARGNQFRLTIPVYIMTSPQTDAETREFLRKNNYFGYPETEVTIFCQGVMPAIDSASGKVLLADRHRIFTNPDGHGGALGALRKSGSIDDMERRGIRYVFYGQIDNPLLQIANPLLTGCHIANASEVTTQVVRKQDPLQKVGNVVSVDGIVQIIEYSDLPEHVAKQTNPDGTLKLWAGSIAVHVFNLDFLKRVACSAESLPFHRAHKRIEYIDADGKLVRPESNNGTKFERFIFDLLPLASKGIVCEVDPDEGFAAVKNSAPAETETPEWVRNKMVALFRRWIEESGSVVADGVAVEIDPDYAIDANSLAKRLPAGTTFTKDTYLKP